MDFENCHFQILSYFISVISITSCTVHFLLYDNLGLFLLSYQISLELGHVNDDNQLNFLKLLPKLHLSGKTV